MSDFESRFLAFLKNRIDAMGVTESGAYEYYAVRVQREDAFVNYERVLMDHILASPPARVVHAGIGIGPVIARLSQAGIPCVGYESDGARYAAAVALREELGLGYELRKAYYPDADIGSGGLLLFTNVGAGWTREQEDAIIATFPNFDEVILDLRLFGHIRNEEADREELRWRIAAVGLVADLPPIAGAFYVRIAPIR